MAKKTKPRGRRPSPKIRNRQLQAARMARGWSRPELARRASVYLSRPMSNSHVFQLETQGRTPRLDDARALARVLGVSMDLLWPPEEAKRKRPAA